MTVTEEGDLGECGGSDDVEIRAGTNTPSDEYDTYREYTFSQRLN